MYKVLLFIIICLLNSSNIHAQLNQDGTICSLPLDTVLLKKNSSANKRISGVGYTKTELLTKFESRPGAQYVAFLEFFPSGTKRGSYTFKQASTRVNEEYIKEVLEVMTKDYEMFNINITTNIDVHRLADKKKRVKLVYADVIGNHGWAGITPNESKWGGDSIVLMDVYADAYAIQIPPVLCGTSSSHELGHVFNLSHDGLNTGAAYYNGNAEWGPIMGNPNHYATWSNGDYSSANNFEDDIAIIGGICGFVKDDITSKKLIINPLKDSLHNKLNTGFIFNKNDVDTFLVTLTSQGNFNVFCNPLNTLYFLNNKEDSNLDVELLLLDANYSILAQNNTAKNRGSQVQLNNAQPGTYYLLIKSGSESNYFTNYGSWGKYILTGYISGSQKETTSLILNNISGVDKKVCSSLGLTPTIEVQNYGSQTLTSLNISTYLNNVLAGSQNITVNIASGDTKTLQLATINTPGSAQLKVIISGNGSESDLTDNEKTVNLTIDDGSNTTITTDMPNFDGTNGLTWQIKNNTNSLIFDSKNYNIQTSGTTIKKQEFCLPKDCYTITLNGTFNICSQTYKSYSNGATYNGGDKVYLNGIVYQAKWWTQSAPNSSTDWSQVGTCNNGPSYSLSIQDENNVNYLTSDFSSNNFTNTASKTFCNKYETAIDTKNLIDSKLTIYPNPTKGHIDIKNAKFIKYVSILSIEGKIVNTIFNNFDSIDLSNLPDGLYIMEIISDNGVENHKIFKQN